MKNPRDIIKRPIITEQTSDFMANKRYVFEVDIRANKTEIKDAVQQIFKVKVSSVNTLRMPAKPKRYGRYNGYTSEWKKAIVQLSVWPLQRVYVRVEKGDCTIVRRQQRA